MKTGLRWGALVFGILGGVWAALPMITVRELFETGDWILTSGIVLLSFVWVSLGWKHPRVAGILLIIQVLLMWIWGGVEFMIMSNKIGNLEPIPIIPIITGHSSQLPLLISGVLFLVSSRRSERHGSL